MRSNTIAERANLRENTECTTSTVSKDAVNGCSLNNVVLAALTRVVRDSTAGLSYSSRLNTRFCASRHGIGAGLAWRS